MLKRLSLKPANVLNNLNSVYSFVSTTTHHHPNPFPESAEGLGEGVKNFMMVNPYGQ
jgi:hypothetical protein